MTSGRRSLPAVAILCVFVTLVPAPVRAQSHGHGPAGAKAPAAILFDNLGTWHHPITTSVPEAQKFFDQGLRLVYAFNHDEAKRSFEEAARLDPKCAMAWWGVAYTLGPNINLPTDPDRAKEAWGAVQKALALESGASDEEKAYIDAIAKRYAADPAADRAKLDAAYSDAMRAVAKRYPDDADAGTLFAESMMDLRPWDFWTKDGQPQPGTNEIVATLEGVIRKHPDHPGANHYYIHAVEASSHPERAMASANRFASGLVPGAGHLVHMPAHIYMRTGQYEGAVEANIKAAAVDEAYFKKVPPSGVYPLMYYPHNLQFLCTAAGMDGKRAVAVKAADDMVAAIPAGAVQEMPMVEMVLPLTIFSRARFGMWDELLSLPAPPAGEHYYTAFWHWGRAIALAAKGKHDEAAKEKSAFDAEAAQAPPDVVLTRNTSGAALALAGAYLGGELAARQGRADEAIAKLEQAVVLEDGLWYDEPPFWYAPVRQTLGAVLLSAKKYAEAEAVYRKDLEVNRENGWSLFGLAQALKAKGAAAEAAEVEKRFEKAWADADVKLTSSRF